MLRYTMRIAFTSFTLLLVTLWAPVASQCFPGCRFSVCDGPQELPIVASSSAGRTGAVCHESKRPVGHIGTTGEAFVQQASGKVSLSAFNATGLRQQLSPSFLKAVALSSKSSAITHEHPQQNQLDFLDGVCVAVPIKNVQFLTADGHVDENLVLTDERSDCAALTLRVSQPPADPSDSLIIPPPTDEEQRFTPESPPLETATPAPTASANVLPSTGNGPIPPETFRELTYALGNSTGDEIVRVRDSELGGGNYRVKYDIETTKAGIVSLDDVTGIVRSASCASDGSVRITLNPNTKINSLDDMYPKGAILVINRAIYGECILSKETPEQAKAQLQADNDTIAAENRAMVRDGYLRIESVKGSPMNAVVRGQPVAFPALFEQAKIVITNLDQVRPKNTTSTAVRMVAPGDGANLIKGETKLELGFGLVEFEVKTEVENDSDFKVLSIDITRWRMDVRVTAVVDFRMMVEVIAKLKVSIQPRSFSISKKFISVPIKGFDAGALKVEATYIGGKRNLTNSVTIPLKFGFFFEIPLILNAEITLERQLTSPAVATFSSGRKEVTFFVTGPYINLDYGSKTITNERYQVDFQPPRLIGLNDPAGQIKLTATVFGGLRPKLSFYFSAIEARLGVDVGTELEVSGALPGGPPFVPKDDGLGDTCDVCHLIEAEVSGVVQNFGLFVTINADFKGWLAKAIRAFLPRNLLAVTLPGNPALKRSILSTCFLKLRDAPLGKDLCGSTCCEGGSTDTCSPNGGPSREAICTVESTPTPGGTPSPSPSPSPIGMTAGFHNDPHLATFDGLRYDCMASGEFVLFRAGTLQVQGRFSGPTTSGSVMTGFVVADGARKIQVHMTSPNTTGAVSLAGCKARVTIDGAVSSSGGAVWTAGLALAFSRETSTISGRSGLSLTFTARSSSTFGCYFESNKLFVPASIYESSKVVGLLGSPNGNPLDDWMKTDGSSTAVPSSRVGKEAYDYCTKYWCIRDAASSLFTYEAGTTHASFNKCAQPYRAVDTSRASASLRAICGSNVQCLIDGIVTGDIDEARRTLQVQADLDASRLAPSSFRFEPSAVTVGVLSPCEAAR